MGAELILEFFLIFFCFWGFPMRFPWFFAIFRSFCSIFLSIPPFPLLLYSFPCNSMCFPCFLDYFPFIWLDFLVNSDVFFAYVFFSLQFHVFSLLFASFLSSWHIFCQYQRFWIFCNSHVAKGNLLTGMIPHVLSPHQPTQQTQTFWGPKRGILL